jgi:hypothetical protein
VKDVKVKTLVTFKDLKADETRIVGEIFEADKKRCEELMNKKLVQVLNDNKKMKKDDIKNEGDEQ